MPVSYCLSLSLHPHLAIDRNQGLLAELLLILVIIYTILKRPKALAERIQVISVQVNCSTWTQFLKTHRDRPVPSIMHASRWKGSTFTRFNTGIVLSLLYLCGKFKTQADKALQQPDLCWTISEQWAAPADSQRSLPICTIRWFYILLKVQPGLRYWGCEFSAYFYWYQSNRIFFFLLNLNSLLTWWLKAEKTGNCLPICITKNCRCMYFAEWQQFFLHRQIFANFMEDYSFYSS